jgi:hypothetical protein
MKGVLFNVVEDVVTEALSADAWDDVVERSGVGGAYTSLGTYPDGEMTAVVGEVATATDMSGEETLRLAGQLGFKHLVARAPHLIEPYQDWKAILTALDDIIHPEVLKIYPGADVPRFAVTADGDDLVVVYTSPRALCALADGLIVGTGTWFETPLTVEHETCVHRGDSSCTMRVTRSG